MSTPLPGQRAGQRPLQAAVAAQRAIGRSLQSTSTVSETLVIHAGGQWQQITVDAKTGEEVLVPYDFQEG